MYVSVTVQVTMSFTEILQFPKLIETKLNHKLIWYPVNLHFLKINIDSSP